MQAVSLLAAYLMKTYHIPPDRVFGHRDTKPTDCPGKYTNVALIRQMASRSLFAEGIRFPDSDQLAVLPDAEFHQSLPRGELLKPFSGGE
jgi:hypothetical protein